jgi:hypothetical protein
MFCPQCGAEYEAGITRCADCGQALTSEPVAQPEAEYVDLVTVLETGDPVELGMVGSVLEEAGIRFFLKGEGVQDIFGFGRIGTGYNVLAGPVEVQVPPENEQEALALLEDLRTSLQAENEADDEDELAPEE